MNTLYEHGSNHIGVMHVNTSASHHIATLHGLQAHKNSIYCSASNLDPVTMKGKKSMHTFILYQKICKLHFNLLGLLRTVNALMN